MFKVLKKNSKWIMAILGTVLMIVFFLPSNQRGTGGRDISENQVATVYDNQPVTLGEKNRADAEVQMLLRQIGFPNSQSGGNTPALVILGRVPAAMISRKPDIFLMLTLEARHMGIQVSNDQVGSLVADVVGIPSDAEDADGARLAQSAMYDLALVRSLLDRVGNTVKITEPQINQNVASQAQEVSLNIVAYSTSQFKDPTTQPTEADIQNLYDAHKDELPGVSTTTNELGFGYKYPNRVKLQYIGVSKTALLDAVKTSKLPYEWEILARRKYRQTPDEFAIPDTNPSTHPTTTAATWETISPAERTRVMDAVYEDAANSLGATVNQRLAEQMAGDWTLYSDAMTAKQPAPMTSLKCTFDSDAYLPALADSIETELHIRPSVHLLPNNWYSGDALKLLEGIGFSSDAHSRPFPQYATEAGFGQNGNPPELALFQPSDPLTIEGGGGTYFFQLTAVDPSHTAPLAEVRDQVVSDLHSQNLWRFTARITEELANSAKALGFLHAVHAAVPAPSPVVSTGPFLPIGVDGHFPAEIPGYDAKDASAAAICEGAIKALIDKAAGRPPIEMVGMPTDHRIAIIELNDARPMWADATGQAKETADLATNLREQTQFEEEAEWVVYDSLVARTKFQLTKRQ